MERLVDPLTTTDAKLWADEFMKVKARLGEQKFDHAMMLGWFANAIMQGYDEGRRRAKADAQATVEALQAQLKTARYEAVRAFIHGENRLCLVCGAKEPCELKDDPSSPCTFDPTPMELKQQVEALQRERERERDEASRKYHEAMNIMSAWKNIDHAEAVARLLEANKALDAERETNKTLVERISKLEGK